MSELERSNAGVTTVRSTLFDVARRAQVSKSTVSLVINGSDRVHPDTAARVWDAIRALNYVPNRAARMLQSGRSNLIGVIVSDITNPYFAELVRSVSRAAKGEYDVFTFDTDYDTDQLAVHLDYVRQHRPDGLLLLTTERSQSVVARLDDLRIPAVLLNWGMAGRRVSELVVDYRPGLEELADHLAQLGHRRLAFVKGPAHFHSAAVREQAFRSVLAGRGSIFAPPVFFDGDFRLDADTGRQVARTLAELPAAQRPTAVVASSDLMAISIVRALQSAGWALPGQMTVAGIDDIALAAYVTPALTTLRLPRQEMGQLAFALLKGLMDDPEAASTFATVAPRLIVRESTALAWEDET